MTKNTAITAICDGASNCWDVVDSLEPYCAKITKILDWFHIAKRFQNISLPNHLQKKLENLKWCIWHNQTDKWLDKFSEIIEKTRSTKMNLRLRQLQTYLKNNKENLTDYNKRYIAKQAISSSIAESNVESLINQRCKGKQHMQWLRSGAHALLQIRASVASNEWKHFGDQYVFDAITKKAA